MAAFRVATKVKAAVEPNLSRASRGAVSLELVVAIGILVTVMFPLAYSFVQEQRLARAYYIRAIAMEIVDGEMEALVAGGWRALSTGSHSFSVSADAARNLPPGGFTVTRDETQLRLEWRPAKANAGGMVIRTARLPIEVGSAP